MATWSAENATEAYLRALKMGERGNEPSAMEFIAALAAGHNSKLMVMASAGSCRAAAVALVCASWQSGGRVVCILRSTEEVAASRKALGKYAGSVEFAVGDAWKLLSSVYKTADFVLMDCRVVGEREAEVFPVARDGFLCGGYNATFHHGGGWWWRSGLGARFLPIGKGLMVARVLPGVDHVKKKRGWVFKVDESTGEQHFYKINSFSNKY